jgi:hypothetical protein
MVNRDVNCANLVRKSLEFKIIVMVKFTLEKATKVQRGSKGMAILVL